MDIPTAISTIEQMMNTAAPTDLEREAWKVIKEEVIDPYPEFRCAYPDGCGKRMNGTCTLIKPCSKYVEPKPE